MLTEQTGAEINDGGVRMRMVLIVAAWLVAVLLALVLLAPLSVLRCWQEPGRDVYGSGSLKMIAQVGDANAVDQLDVREILSELGATPLHPFYQSHDHPPSFWVTDSGNVFSGEQIMPPASLADRSPLVRSNVGSGRSWRGVVYGTGAPQGGACALVLQQNGQPTNKREFALYEHYRLHKAWVTPAGDDGGFAAYLSDRKSVV